MIKNQKNISVYVQYNKSTLKIYKAKLSIKAKMYKINRNLYFS